MRVYMLFRRRRSGQLVVVCGTHPAHLTADERCSKAAETTTAGVEV